MPGVRPHLDAVNLKLDWCSPQAARFACEKWHYSGTYPVTKTARIGVWEDGVFIGAIVFSCGSGSACNGTKYGLAKMFEVAELQRVALRKHKSSVTKMLAIAIRMIRAKYPGLRMLISFADPGKGHHGGIYQGGGWLYCGRSAAVKELLLSDGRWVHLRSTGKQWGAKRLAGRLQVISKRKTPGKHRYVFPLCDEVRKRIIPLPYPKRAGSADSGTTCNQHGGGGATPTPALT